MTQAPKKERLEYCLFESNLPAVLEMTRREANIRVTKAAFLFRKTLLDNLSGTRSGIEYYVPGSGKYETTKGGKKRRKANTGEFYMTSTGKRRGVPGTGEYYYTKSITRRIAGTGVKYKASKPGEYPAKRLGGLGQSIKSITEEHNGEHRAIVGTDLIYARELEGKKRPVGRRPFFQRTYNEIAQQIKDIMTSTW